MNKPEYMQCYQDCCTGQSWRDTLQQVWFAMDACNLSGVVHSWAAWVSLLWQEAQRLGRGTDWVNQHPVNVILADKLRQLARSSAGTDRETWAYEWTAGRVAGGQY